MPQRFLRPGIRTSALWNSVSRDAQILFVSLLTLVDDFGRYDGRPSVLCGDCFSVWNELHPDDVVTPQRIAALYCEILRAKLVDIYESEGKKVIQVTQWQERARSDKSKWPDPLRNPAESCGILPPSPLAIVPSPSPVAASTSNNGEHKQQEIIMDNHGRHVPWENAESWLTSATKNGSNYTRSEARTAWLAMEAGGWMWGKNPVADWRSALERQIQTDRNHNSKQQQKKRPHGNI